MEIDRSERSRYEVDVFKDYASQKIGGERRWFFLATLDHVRRLLHEPESILMEPSVVRTIGEMSAREEVDSRGLASAFVDLHQRYAAEWVRCLDKIRHEYPSLDAVYRQLSAEGARG